MRLLSQTNFGNQTTADIIAGNTVSFTRASAKTNYATGSDTASGTAQFKTNLLPSYHSSALVTDHADGATSALAVDRAGRIWGALGSLAAAKVYMLDPTGTNSWSLVKDFGAGKYIKNIFCSQKSGYIFVSIQQQAAGSSGLIYRSTAGDGTDDFALILTMTGAGAYGDLWSFTDAADGRVWISEYGGMRGGPAATWQANHAYTDTIGGAADVVIPTTPNGFYYVCNTTGTHNSGASEPTWGTTIGGITNDGATSWMCITAGTQAASRIYGSTDEGATWTTTFNWESDFVPGVDKDSDGNNLFHANVHIHKIIYNPGNDYLYFAHGDDDPCYVYKLSGGTRTGASHGGWGWINYRLTEYSTTYTYIKCTSAVSLSNGNVLWGEDQGRHGFFLHSVSDDTFIWINTRVSGIANFYHMKVIDNIIYAPVESNAADSDQILILRDDDPYNFIILDYATGAAAANGWRKIAGKGNDNYIYTALYNSSANLTTKKYKKPVFSSKAGLSLDPITNNGFLDPFSDVGSGGWSDYSATHHSSTGGKYKSAYLISATSVDSNYITLANLTDIILISGYLKRLTTTGSYSMRFYIREFDGGNNLLATSSAYYLAQYNRVPLDYWEPFAIQINPSGFNASTVKITIRWSPPGATWGVDCCHIEQGKIRRKLEGLASGAAADSIQTTIGSALPATCTIAGTAVSRYQFDSAGLYCLFEAKSADGTHWIKLIEHNSQIKLIDNANNQTSPIITTTTGISQFSTLTASSLGSPGPDIYYWALTFYNDGSAKVALNVATQRTNIETPSPVAYTLSNDLTIIYDGCSHTAGEELGGEVLGRGVFDSQLAIADIKELWENQCQWHGPLGFF